MLEYSSNQVQYRQPPRHVPRDLDFFLCDHVLANSIVLTRRSIASPFFKKVAELCPANPPSRTYIRLTQLAPNFIPVLDTVLPRYRKSASGPSPGFPYNRGRKEEPHEPTPHHRVLHRLKLLPSRRRSG